MKNNSNYLGISGINFKIALQKRRIKHEDAAILMGVSRQTISTWCNKDYLSSNVVANVKTKLNIDLVEDVISDFELTHNTVTNTQSNMRVDDDLKFSNTTKAREGSRPSRLNINLLGDNRPIPVYNLSFSVETMKNISGFMEDYRPVSTLLTDEAQGCDFVVRNKLDTMLPKITPGDGIGIKRMADWKSFLPPGHIYAIIADPIEVMGYVKKGETEDAFTIVSENRDYDDFQLPKIKIKDIWAVRFVMAFPEIKTF